MTVNHNTAHRNTAHRNTEHRNTANRNVALALVLLALSLPEGAHAGTDEWTSQGPNGGYVYALAIDPQTPSTIYAGTASGGGGVYKSIDGGTTWTGASDGLPAATVYVLAIDPANPSTVYCGTVGGGVYKSTDGGEHWNGGPVSPGASQIVALAIDPAVTSTLYAAPAFANNGDRVYKSTDGGESWAAASDGLTSADLTALTVDPTNPGVVYAGSSSGVFKTTDGGGQWTAINNGLTSLFVNALAIDPFDSATLYAGGSGVSKSTDGGDSWTAVNNGLGVDDYSLPGVATLALDPSTPGTVYAGAIRSEDGVYKTTDGGDSWVPVDTGLDEPDVRALAIDPSDPEVLYAGTADFLECSYYSGGVYKTTDGGDSWVVANHGLSSTRVLALAIDPTMPQSLWAGIDGSGAAQSLDGGATWSQDGGDATVPALAIDPSTPSRRYRAFWECIALDPGGLIREDADGTTDVSLDSPRPVRQLLIDALDPANLYAVTGYHFQTAGVFYRSPDHGDTWTTDTTGLPDAGVTMLAKAPSATALYTGTLEGVYKSLDRGASWTATGPGLADAVIAALAVAAAEPQIVYAGTPEGVFRSTDGGDGWSPAGLTETAVNALAIDPLEATTVYAGTSAGVFKSTDGGGAWAAFNLGLEGVPVRALVIDPLEPSTLHAATDRGVFDITQSPCLAGGAAACLNAGRFRVEVTWRSFDDTTGSGRIAELGSDDSGLFWFFEDDNWEMLVKVLDGCAINQRFWVFAAATTTVEYTLRVTDTETDTVREYFNPLGTAANAITDTDAFACAESPQGPPASGPVIREPTVVPGAARVRAPEKTDCVPSATGLCLSQGRFSVAVEWRDYAGNTGPGRVVGGGNDTSGLFWFFNPSNWEMLVKVLDACDVNGQFLFLGAATTDVEYTLTITDTETGVEWQHTNPLGQASEALIHWFGTCP